MKKSHSLLLNLASRISELTVAVVDGKKLSPQQLVHLQQLHTDVGRLSNWVLRGIEPPEAKTVLDREAYTLTNSRGRNIGFRARKAFMRLGVRSLGDLIKLSAGDLLVQRGCGMTTVRSIQDGLRALGLSLRGES